MWSEKGPALMKRRKKKKKKGKRGTSVDEGA
jgi:hypothetical protein